MTNYAELKKQALINRLEPKNWGDVSPKITWRAAQVLSPDSYRDGGDSGEATNAKLYGRA